MPVVFVHGVNNRIGPGYDAGVLAKRAFFQKHLAGATIGGKTLAAKPDVTFPYWGDLATTFRWNMASLPHGEMQALGGGADVDLQPLLAHVRDAFPDLPADNPLTALAKERLSLAVDVVTDLALQSVQKGDEKDVAEFVVQASAYAEANPAPAWLAGVTNDQQFLTTLQATLAAGPGVQALGGLGKVFGKVQVAAAKFKTAVKSMAGKAVDKAGDFASTKLLASSRDSLNATLGRFFGDVFIYMNGRGDSANPGPIPKVLLKAFDDARQSAPNEPFVIVGHSLGGVITFDLLSHFRPNFDVDLFVSVGSQVAHFEEIKLYKVSDANIGPPNKAPKPANVKRWINVYDEVDIFSYAAAPIFNGVDIDARYDTQTYTIKAHGAYFEQDRFYQRLRARIGELP